jgi:N-acetylglucosamine-6-phosphate deacetylase
MYLAGMAPGTYTFSGMKVILMENGMLLNAEQNVLAGASFPLKKGIENIMDFTGVPFHDAIKMASENVARVYNLKNRGTLEVGKRADIILVERKDSRLKIMQTYKGGFPV